MLRSPCGPPSVSFNQSDCTRTDAIAPNPSVTIAR